MFELFIYVLDCAKFNNNSNEIISLVSLQLSQKSQRENKHSVLPC